MRKILRAFTSYGGLENRELREAEAEEGGKAATKKTEMNDDGENSSN